MKLTNFILTQNFNDDDTNQILVFSVGWTLLQNLAASFNL